MLQRFRRGDGTVDDMMPLVYKELRRLASSFLRDQAPGHTLQPTALVHEAYLRMVHRDSDWNDRAHFFNLAATIMRQILVDHARTKLAAKRGGGQAKVKFEESLTCANE